MGQVARKSPRATPTRHSNHTESLKTAMRAYEENNGDGEADISELIAAARACKGLHVDEADTSSLDSIVRKVLLRTSMDVATADCASELMAMRPPEKQGGDLLHAAVQAVKRGIPLHLRFGGGASELAVATCTEKDSRVFQEFAAARDGYEKV